jgi:hypothetical protein
MTPPINEKTRASLPLRDYAIGTATLIGWTVILCLYIDRRFSALEASRAALTEKVAEIQAGRASDNAKLDRVIETLSDVRTGVARIEERTRK